MQSITRQRNNQLKMYNQGVITPAMPRFNWNGNPTLGTIDPKRKNNRLNQEGHTKKRRGISHVDCKQRSTFVLIMQTENSQLYGTFKTNGYISIKIYRMNSCYVEYLFQLLTLTLQQKNIIAEAFLNPKHRIR